MIRGDTCDIAVIGAGTAGCVAAVRLAEALDLDVRIYEAGGAPTPRGRERTPGWRQPGAGVEDWGLCTDPLPATNGRRLGVPRPKVIGGSSVAYMGVALRPLPGDLDSWARFGGAAWSSDGLGRWLDRAVRDVTVEPEDPTTHVPLPIRRFGESSWSEHELAFREAAIRGGHRPLDNLNADGCDGVGAVPSAWFKGAPVDVADAYLARRRGRATPTVVSGAHVVKVHLENGRACGLDYVGEDTGRHRVRAREGVILCAGAFGSPAVLMRSGIGPAQILRSHGIHVTTDRRGVGSNLQDHPLLVVPYLLRRDAPEDRPPFKVMLRASGPPGDGALQVLLRTSRRSRHAPRGQSILLCLVALMKPASRGLLRFRSPDPFGLPGVDPNYLGSSEDRAALAAGVALIRGLVDAPPLRDLVQRPLHSSAELVTRTLTTYHHFVGTCRVGMADDPDAVVDPSGRVREVDRLWIADASVLPTLPRANVIWTVVALAERSAHAVANTLDAGRSGAPPRP